MNAAERIAKCFHGVYEEIAPDYGYATREASAVPWEQVPEANRGLMVATVQALIDAGVIVDWDTYAEAGVSPRSET